jgi:hypothetical protein
MIRSRGRKEAAVEVFKEEAAQRIREEFIKVDTDLVRARSFA